MERMELPPTLSPPHHFGPHPTGILYLLLPVGAGGQSEWSNVGPRFIGEQGPGLKGNVWAPYDLCSSVTG